MGRGNFDVINFCYDLLTEIIFCFTFTSFLVYIEEKAYEDLPILGFSMEGHDWDRLGREDGAPLHYWRLDQWPFFFSMVFAELENNGELVGQPFIMDSQCP